MINIRAIYNNKIIKVIIRIISISILFLIGGFIVDTTGWQGYFISESITVSAFFQKGIIEIVLWPLIAGTIFTLLLFRPK
jgi:hypothetical protein